ncbi:DUF4309 domain-containing protein [Paenibacillus hodogayensis]|uniref:DUF4309 domain-containing protein n=1 Tax=Paenibacillus hodogayensis TaxID=279208 RepID=A0ABV5VXG3_9BACL
MKLRRNFRLWGVAILMGAVCAGCNTTKAVSENPLSLAVASASEKGAAVTEQNRAPATGQQPADVQQTVENAVLPDQTPQVTQNPEPPQQQPSSSDKKVQTSETKPKDNKAEAPAIEPYDVKKPSLMGIRLTDTRKAVVQKFNKPNSEFEMDDETDPIAVYEYDGFIVGFNSADTVEFVEITSKDVNPGLNGLRLGQKVKDAEAALGKPDTNTNYALHYKAGKTVLKLDIDPKSEAIQSIKLFAGRS